MEKKIDNYIEVLFSDIPRSKKSAELKEELRANMNERYRDYLNQGESETQAYSLTVANLGNVDEMLAEVRPNEDFKSEAQRYLKRNAMLTGISVGMYILGAAVVVAGAMFENPFAAVVGVVILLVLAAIATGLIVYSGMSTPQEYKDYFNMTTRGRRSHGPRSNKRLQGILSIYWAAIVSAYLIWSFLSMDWHITWLIWPVAAVFSGIISTVYDMRHDDE